MEVEELKNLEEIDHEWEELLLTARDLGITPDEIRIFLSQMSEKKQA